MKKNDFLIAFLDLVPTGGALLDVGCGTGKTARLFYEKRKDVVITAVDIRDMSKGLPPGTLFKQISAEDVGEAFPENAFDAVVCQHVAEHLLYPTKMMEGIKKDGVLLLETPNWVRAFFPFYRNFLWNDYTHVRIFSKVALRRLLKDFEFQQEKEDTFCSIEEEKKNFSLQSILKALATPFFRDTLVYIARNGKETV